MEFNRAPQRSNFGRNKCGDRFSTVILELWRFRRKLIQTMKNRWPLSMSLAGLFMLIIGGVFVTFPTTGCKEMRQERSKRPVFATIALRGTEESSRRAGSIKVSREEKMRMEEIDTMKAQFEHLRDLKGEPLVRAFLELNVENNTIRKVLPEYQSEKAQLRSATRGEYSPEHSEVLTLQTSIDAKLKQMSDAVEAFKKNLQLNVDAMENRRELPWISRAAEIQRRRRDNPQKP
jgi:hypothetical protein